MDVRHDWEILLARSVFLPFKQHLALVHHFQRYLMAKVTYLVSSLVQ
jgi:hypothetical protein